MKRHLLLNRSFLLLALLLVVACTNEDIDVSELDFSEVKGKPIQFDFKGIIDENGITRSTPLPTGVTVWVSIDEGQHWYPYIWDQDKQLWKPKSTAVTWTNKTMTIYAAVRYDLNSDTWNNTFIIKPDQSAKENYDKSDFLGARQHVTYTSGRISMTLQHRVVKLVVLAQLPEGVAKENLLTCATIASSVVVQKTATTGIGRFPITGTVNCGGLNVDVESNKEIKEGDVVTAFPSDDDNYYNSIQFYKENTIQATNIDGISGLDNSRTAVFCAYFLNQPKKVIGLKFTYNKSGTIYSLTPSFRFEQGGIGLEAGCISCITLFINVAP